MTLKPSEIKQFYDTYTRKLKSEGHGHNQVHLDGFVRFVEAELARREAASRDRQAFDAADEAAQVTKG